MKLTVQRMIGSSLSTQGELSIDGTFFCYTLEPRIDQSQGKPYCIPEGIYKVTLEKSPRFQMVTPHVQDVPGFENIEIHPGNFPEDTEGCLLVGEERRADFVGVSRVCFAALMERLQGQTDLTIEYHGIFLTSQPEKGLTLQ